MSMTDPIADMLTRLRNALMASHTEVEIPMSRVKSQIAGILRSQGFIKSYEVVAGEGDKKNLRIGFLPPERGARGPERNKAGEQARASGVCEPRVHSEGVERNGDRHSLDVQGNRHRRGGP